MSDEYERALESLRALEEGRANASAAVSPHADPLRALVLRAWEAGWEAREAFAATTPPNRDYGCALHQGVMDGVCGCPPGPRP